MKIGFYGDSFCNEVNNAHNLYYKYETYIKKLKKHYNADITHLGTGGSSHWDVILNQFKIDNNLPDVCIFCWTDYARLYNSKVRDLTYNSVLSAKAKDWKPNRLLNPFIHTAAKHYFNHLYDNDKSMIEYLSALYYFDKMILSQISSSTKIIHLWSFNSNGHRWTTGLTVKTPLVSITNLKDELPNSSIGPNHFGDANKNQIAFEWIKEAIDNYQLGDELEFKI
jgi:hypothetical protein